MLSDDLIGKNIHFYRTLYGESQSQLAKSVRITKGAISNIERGKGAGIETLTRIAHHYDVPIQMIIEQDPSMKIRVEIDDRFSKNLRTIFPVVSSDAALQNEAFCEAHAAHLRMYELCGNYDMSAFDDFDKVCGYFDVSDEGIEQEVTANSLAVLLLLLLFLKGLPNQGDPQEQAGFKHFERLHPNLVSSFDWKSYVRDAEEALDELEDDGIDETVSERLIELRRSTRLRDLADYYLALQYLLGLKDSGWGFEIDRIVGSEMLLSLASVGNQYALETMRIILGFPTSHQQRYGGIPKEYGGIPEEYASPVLT